MSENSELQNNEPNTIPSGARREVVVRNGKREGRASQFITRTAIAAMITVTGILGVIGVIKGGNLISNRQISQEHGNGKNALTIPEATQIQGIGWVYGIQANNTAETKAIYGDNGNIIIEISNTQDLQSENATLFYVVVNTVNLDLKEGDQVSYQGTLASQTPVDGGHYYIGTVAPSGAVGFSTPFSITT